MDDESIIKEIYSKRDVYLKYIIRYNIHEDAANDVFQDSVIALIQSKCSINDKLSYFCTIVKNKCVSYVRKHRLKLVDIETIGNIEFFDRIQVNSDKIVSLFNSLDDNEQFIINEHIYKEKTFKQISDESNIPVTTLQSLFYRILNKLKLKYDTYGIEYFFE